MAAKTAICKLSSLSPYNQSRQHFVPKKDKETHADYEARTWRDKGHYDENGMAYIPPMAFKTCLAVAAQMMDRVIPGRGKTKYTKYFKSGIMVTDGLPLGVSKKDVEPQWLSMSGTGRKGEMGVLRAFPHFMSWAGEISFAILDETITKEIFKEFLIEAGNFTGIGQYRPEKGGHLGRFELLSIRWA